MSTVWLDSERDEKRCAHQVNILSSCPAAQASMCTDETAGILSDNGEVCCSLGCDGKCGGPGCSEFGGLGGYYCCVGAITEVGVTCGDGQEAPCLVPEEGKRGVAGTGTDWGDLSRVLTQGLLSQPETDEPMRECLHSVTDLRSRNVAEDPDPWTKGHALTYFPGVYFACFAFIQKSSHTH